MHNLTNPIDEVNQTDTQTGPADSEPKTGKHPESGDAQPGVKLMTIEERQKLRRKILAHRRAFK